MRDPQQTIRLLEAKAQNDAVTASEREAIQAKIADLRKRHPEPPPAPTTIPLLTFLTTTYSTSPTATVRMKRTRRAAPKEYTSSFSFGASEGVAEDED